MEKLILNKEINDFYLIKESYEIDHKENLKKILNKNNEKLNDEELDEELNNEELNDEELNDEELNDEELNDEELNEEEIIKKKDDYSIEIIFNKLIYLLCKNTIILNKYYNFDKKKIKQLFLYSIETNDIDTLKIIIKNDILFDETFYHKSHDPRCDDNIEINNNYAKIMLLGLDKFLSNESLNDYLNESLKQNIFKLLFFKFFSGYDSSNFKFWYQRKGYDDEDEYFEYKKNYFEYKKKLNNEDDDEDNEDDDEYYDFEYDCNGCGECNVCCEYSSFEYDEFDEYFSGNDISDEELFKKINDRYDLIKIISKYFNKTKLEKLIDPQMFKLCFDQKKHIKKAV